jgi:hypothetical protein
LIVGGDGCTTLYLTRHKRPLRHDPSAIRLARSECGPQIFLGHHAEQDPVGTHYGNPSHLPLFHLPDHLSDVVVNLDRVQRRRRHVVSDKTGSRVSPRDASDSDVPRRDYAKQHRIRRITDDRNARISLIVHEFRGVREFLGRRHECRAASHDGARFHFRPPSFSLRAQLRRAYDAASDYAVGKYLTRMV